MLFPQSLIRILRSKIYDYLGVITRDIEKGNAEALGKRTGEWLDAGLSLLAIGWTAVKQMKKPDSRKTTLPPFRLVRKTAVPLWFDSGTRRGSFLTTKHDIDQYLFRSHEIVKGDVSVSPKPDCRLSNQND